MVGQRPAGAEELGRRDHPESHARVQHSPARQVGEYARIRDFLDHWIPLCERHSALYRDLWAIKRDPETPMKSVQGRADTMPYICRIFLDVTGREGKHPAGS
jgi:hypothetical protein